MPPKYKRSEKKRRVDDRHSVKLRKSSLKKSFFSKKNRVNLSKFLSLALVFILSVAFLCVFLFLNYLNKNKIFAVDEADKSLYGQIFPTLLFVTVRDFDAEPIQIDKLNFLIFDDYSKKNTIYNIPVSLVVDYPGKYGEEEISKAFAFGGIINENDTYNTGLGILQGSVFKIFGLKPSKYLVVTADYAPSMEKLLFEGDASGMVNKDVVSDYGSKVRSNLSVQDLYQRFKFINSVPRDRIVQKSLTQESIQNPDILNQDLSDLSVDSPLNNDKLSIAVLNATDMAGVAAFASRAIQNLGGRVVAVNNASQTLEESVIVAGDPGTPTAAILSEVFEIDKIMSKSDFTLLNQGEFDRADVIVIVGFDRGREM